MDIERPLKIVFAGTPEFAAKHLDALYESDHEVLAVYTQPDRPAGRGKKLMQSDVKKRALEAKTPVFQPQNFKSQTDIEQLSSLNADVMVVVAYGIILPKAVLDIPAYGCINVHGSLLPKWRGAAPIQRAIWAGDKFTGVSIMKMDEGLDTGDVILEKSMAITPSATSSTLYEDLAELGPSALVEALDNLYELELFPQDNSLASYAKKLTKEEAKMDWMQTAQQLSRNVRAFNPWPICWFEYEGLTIKVWQSEVVESLEETPAGLIVAVEKEGIEVATKKHNLLITKIQLPGKKPMYVKDVLNGKPDLFTVGKAL